MSKSDPERRLAGDKRHESITFDGVAWVVRWPQPQPTVRGYLNSLLADNLPPFIPAGQYSIPGPPAAVEAALVEQETAARKHFRSVAGAATARRKGRVTKRDKTARPNAALLAAVKAYRKEHPDHGRPAIAAALLPKHGCEIDPADPNSRRRAVVALTKRIERLEKSLDK
jgi:hypothetical protein